MEKVRVSYAAGMFIGTYELLGFCERRGMTNWWAVRCSGCGYETIKPVAQLSQNVRKGCKTCTNGTKTHGQNSTNSPTYVSWCRMLQRVRGTDPNAKHFERGIGVCERWLSFENFLHDMGERPAGHSLDRENNDLGYNPENCRWATPTQQNVNTSINAYISFEGVTKTLSEWIISSGINKDKLAEAWASYGEIGVAARMLLGNQDLRKTKVSLRDKVKELEVTWKPGS